MFDSELYELHKKEIQRRMVEHAIKLAPPKTWLQKVADKLSPKATAFPTASASPWINHYIFIDTSDWSPNIDWAFLASVGVHGGIAKAFEIQENVSKNYWPQKTYANAIQGMYNAKMMGCGYMFQNGYAIAGEGSMQGISLPAVKGMSEAEDNEYQYTKAAWTNKASYYSQTGNLSMWMVDVERWWQDYNEYNDYLRGGRTIDKVKVMEPTFIMADLQSYLGHLTLAIRQKRLPNIPIVLYTGKWFTDAYCVSLGQNLFYNAAVGWKPEGITVCTASYTMPAVTTTWDKVFDGTYLPTTAPFDAGFGSATMWQFAGGAEKLPNGKFGNAGFDLDLACINNGLFDLQFGASPTPTPIPTVTYTVTGKVTLDGNGLPGVSVTLGNFSSIIGSDGTFTFTNVPSGTNGSIIPVLSGYTFSPISITISNLSVNMTGQNFVATTNPITPPPVNVDLTEVNTKLDTIITGFNRVFK